MKIVNKISLSVFFVTLICSFLGLSYIYIVSKNSLKQAIYQNLQAVVSSRAEHVKTYLKMLEVSVGQLTKSVVIEDFLKITDKEDSGYPKAFERVMIRLKRTKEINPSIYEFLLLDKTGKIIASSNPDNLGVDKSTDDYFIYGQKNMYIKDAYYNQEKKESFIASSGPILDSQTNALLGVLVARIKLDDLNAM